MSNLQLCSDEHLIDSIKRLTEIIAWEKELLLEEKHDNICEEDIRLFFEKIRGGLFLCNLANTLLPNSISMKLRNERTPFNKRFCFLFIYF